MANWCSEVSVRYAGWPDQGVRRGRGRPPYIMVRNVAVFLGFFSLGWCENSLSHQERKDGFESLFDGKTLAKWHSIKQTPGAGAWRVRKGIMTWEKGGSWLATDDTYYDF